MLFRSLRWLLALGALALLIFSPTAGAATFGADLNNPVTNTVTCGQGAPPLFFTDIGSPSCLWFSGAPGAVFYAPDNGTITTVRVKVGATTGPMQIVVMRSIYQNKAGDPGHPYFACCFVQEYGPTFTPTANAITSVATNLPMVEQPTPGPDDFTTNAAGDFLALSVLDPNVPIPMFIDNSSGASGFYPAPTAGTFPAPSPTPLFPSTDLPAGQMSMSADLQTGAPTPCPTPTPGPLPTPTPLLIPQLKLPKLTIPVNGGTATVPIQCLVVNCNGNIVLQNAKRAGLASVSRKSKTVSYGTAKFSLKAGSTGKVKIKLNAAGKKLLKAHKKVKVWANLSFTSGGGAAKSVHITLKR